MGIYFKQISRELNLFCYDEDEIGIMLKNSNIPFGGKGSDIRPFTEAKIIGIK